jgi:Xaa-Pro aminopeptidase
MRKEYTHIFVDNGWGQKAGEYYARRRKKFAAKSGHLVVLRGVYDTVFAQNPFLAVDVPFFQAASVLYLSGINQQDIALLLCESSEILFLPRVDEKTEFWTGKKLGVGSKESLAQAQKITGFKDIRDIATLDEVVKEHLQQAKIKKLGAVWFSGKRQYKDFNLKFKKHLQYLVRTSGFGKDCLVNVGQKLLEQRLVLDEQEIRNAKKANEITKAIFKKLESKLGSFSNEADVNAFLIGEAKKLSRFGLSFAPIVAVGKSALILHYEKKDEDFKKDELLLIDFGVRWQNMCADVSRTMPVSGKFNPLQKLLYQIVEDAQKLVEQKVRPGITIKDLDKICWDFINKALEERFVKKGGKLKLKYKDRPHSVSHLLGYAVHDGDPFGKYKEQKIQPGWLLTNEPGIYGDFEIVLKGKKYKEQIGIRLEDNLLITKNGCRNLSV